MTNIMYVPNSAISCTSANCFNITIQNLVVDGNRGNNAIPDYPWSLHDTNSATCYGGAAHTPCSHNYVQDPATGTYSKIPDYAGNFVDMRIGDGLANLNPGCWRCIVINNVTFKEAVGHGLQLSMSGIEVEYSTFTNAFLGGAITWQTSNIPVLKYLEIYWSNFSGCGVSGIYMNNGGSNGVYAREYLPNYPNWGPNVNSNTLTGNHREFSYRFNPATSNTWNPFPGGQIYSTAHGVTFYNNVINGDNPLDGDPYQGQAVSGGPFAPDYYLTYNYGGQASSQPNLGTNAIELYYDGHYVTTNQISNQLIPGIGLAGGLDVEIYNNTVTNSGEAANTAFGAIQVSSSSGFISQCVNITRNTIKNNPDHGITLWYPGYTMSGITCGQGINCTGQAPDTNTYSGNTGTNVYSNPAYPPSASCPSYIYQ